MHHLTNYYKNLCEQLQEKINILESNIQQLDEIKKEKAMRIAAKNPDDPRVLSGMARQAYRLAKTGVAQDIETDSLVRGFGLQPAKAIYNTGYGREEYDSANYPATQIAMPGAGLPAREVGQTEAEVETGNPQFSRQHNPQQQKAAPVAAAKASRLNRNLEDLAKARGTLKGTIHRPGLAPHFASGEPVKLDITDTDLINGEYHFVANDEHGNQFGVVQDREDGRESEYRGSVELSPISYPKRRYVPAERGYKIDPSRIDIQTALGGAGEAHDVVDADRDGDHDAIDSAAMQMKIAKMWGHRNH